MENAEKNDFQTDRINEFIKQFVVFGGTPELLEALIRDSVKVTEVVEIAKGHNFTKGISLAKLILNDDFISPDQVEKVLGCKYSQEQYQNFVDTLPGLSALIKISNNGFVLMAGPHEDLSLLQMAELYEHYFHTKPSDWFGDEKHSFSKNDVIKAGSWLAVRKDLVPDTRRMVWLDQKEYISDPEYLPNVAELCYASILYKKICGGYLLPDYYVRSSSSDGTDGNFVFVGFQNYGGIYVYLGNNESKRFDLAIKTALKI